MLKKTGAEKDYISQKTRQLSDYRNQYLDFLKKTGRTRISANEWIGENKSIIRYLKNQSVKKYYTTQEITTRTRNIISNKFANRTSGIKIKRIKANYDYFSPKENKIYLGNNANEYSFIHELGHKLYTNFTKEEFEVYTNIIKNKFSKYTKKDFILKKDSTGTYWVLKDSSDFVSKYQTRIYKSLFSFKRGKPNIDYALEYISEGIKYYYKNPLLLKKKDKELYDFIERLI